MWEGIVLYFLRSCVFSNLIWYVTQLQTLTSAATKKGGQSSGDVGALYKYKNALLDVKLDTQSTVCFFTSIISQMLSDIYFMHHHHYNAYSTGCHDINFHRHCAINKDNCFIQTA